MTARDGLAYECPSQSAITRPEDGMTALCIKHCQGGHIWGNALVTSPDIPDPSQWGWQMVSKRWQPLWISKTVISKALNQLVSCGCAKMYKLPCKCCVAGVSCTTLCACRGHCYRGWLIHSLHIWSLIDTVHACGWTHCNTGGIVLPLVTYVPRCTLKRPCIEFLHHMALRFEH